VLCLDLSFLFCNGMVIVLLGRPALGDHQPPQGLSYRRPSFRPCALLQHFALSREHRLCALGLCLGLPFQSLLASGPSGDTLVAWAALSESQCWPELASVPGDLGPGWGQLGSRAKVCSAVLALLTPACATAAPASPCMLPAAPLLLASALWVTLVLLFLFQA
jgi:hypothetical protein